MKVIGRKQVVVVADKAIGGYHHIVVVEGGNGARAVVANVSQHLERRRELCCLAGPVMNQRQRHNNQTRGALGDGLNLRLVEKRQLCKLLCGRLLHFNFIGRCIEQQRQRLKSFAKSHIIGQTTAKPIAFQ